MLIWLSGPQNYSLEVELIQTGSNLAQTGEKTNRKKLDQTWGFTSGDGRWQAWEVADSGQGKR